jgi:hypothetical protein
VFLLAGAFRLRCHSLLLQLGRGGLELVNLAQAAAGAAQLTLQQLVILARDALVVLSSGPEA